MALTWNRSDIAERDIFKDQPSFNSKDLEETIFKAILLDRVDFLKVCINNGVDVSEIMTIGKLRNLYNSALAENRRNTPEANHLHRRLRGAVGGLDPVIPREISHGHIRLVAIHQLISNLLGCNYSFKKTNSNDERDSKGASINDYFCDRVDGSRQDFSLPQSIADSPLTNTFRELFIFAVLFNRPEMAEFFWKSTNDCLCLALMATKIFHSLADRCEGHQIDLKTSYENSKKRFEDLACSLCNEAFKAQQERALILVERRYEMISGSTCLDMGAQAKAESFLSTTCCQEALDSLWKQGIRSKSFFVFLALILPFCIPFMDIERPGEEARPLRPIEKFKAFYMAPVTKFLLWHLSYLLYLILYTYVLIFDFEEYPSPIEITIYAWTFTLFIDLISEIWQMHGFSLYRSFLRWIDWSYWNIAILVTYGLHLIGVICRLYPDGNSSLNYAGKIFLASCLFIGINRFSRIFSIHSWLGPKLVMIQKMVKKNFSFFL